ncbi:GTP 3',8-cyclase MoaA [Corynebacterium breve]|uniref:GTP 3',8-cyclase n=1 Tax=Corynebacterium breve TaxID=3049799 RepID=A0ABY8VG58_9CORY|nr:GTP 3',8-cyclase MoaA [Corynebacterium breve]WIM68625.1 GTP 3',8-cyclase MoaA [Corynebacterium breve]
MTDREASRIPLRLTPVRTQAGNKPRYEVPDDLPLPGSDSTRKLVDRFGRTARDLRVSLTDRCNLRCTYCMPEEGLEWIPTEATLNDEEVIRLIRIGVEKLGIRQVRFTGGEPLLRKNLGQILSATKILRTDEGLSPQTALTTNGLGLARQAAALAEAGLDRVNISLDTVDRELYATLTRRDRIHDVFAAIDASIAAGLAPVKLNAVVMPGINEDGLVDLTRYALRTGAQLRFIEQMPLGPRDQWGRADMVTAEDLLRMLRFEFDLTPASEPRGSAPAALWNITDGSLHGRIGIIASVTHPFCGDCDRTRLTTDGAIRNCLFAAQDAELSLRDLMRAGATDDELATAWASAMWVKKPGHGIDDEGFLQPDRPMSAIGG